MDTYYYCKMALNENEAEENLRLYNIHQSFLAADEGMEGIITMF